MKAITILFGIGSISALDSRCPSESLSDIDSILSNCYAICCFDSDKNDKSCLDDCDAQIHSKIIPTGNQVVGTHQGLDIDTTPDECVQISHTNVCSPWAAGYYINTTELSMVYDQKFHSADDWQQLVYKSTNGGEYQKNAWKTFAGCNGYLGEPIQYSRSYTCLTDLFLFSAGCNKRGPEPKPCADTCQVYGNAVKSLLKSKTACPSLSKLAGGKDYQRFESNRAILLTAADSCSELLKAWDKGKFEGFSKNAKGFSAGYASEYEEDDTKETCPADHIVGVDDDISYCGFGGNLEIANAYCRDYPRNPCCKKLASQDGSKGEVITTGEGENEVKEVGEKTKGEDEKETNENPNVQSLLKTQNIQADSIQSTSSNSSPTAGIVLGTLGGLLGLGGLAIFYKKKTHNKRYFFQKVNKTDNNQRGMSIVSSTTAHSGGVEKRYTVVHDYHQSLPDELELRKGDFVVVLSSYDDGWGKGRNLGTMLEGTFPLACLKMN